MSTSNPWQADWHARLYEAVQQLGYSRVTEFVKDRPAATWSQLVEELENQAGARFAPVQLYTVLQSEITTPEELSYYIKSTLVRRLRESIPQGWDADADFRFKLAMAFAAWAA